MLKPSHLFVFTACSICQFQTVLSLDIWSNTPRPVETRQLVLKCLDAREDDMEPMFISIEQKNADDSWTRLGGCEGGVLCMTIRKDNPHKFRFHKNDLLMEIESVLERRDRGKYRCHKLDKKTSLVNVSEEIDLDVIFQEPLVLDYVDVPHTYCLGQTCYSTQFLSTEGYKSRDEASKLCESHGMTLPRADNEDEAQYLEGIINGHSYLGIKTIWLNYIYDLKNKSWTGMINYHHWGSGYPASEVSNLCVVQGTDFDYSHVHWFNYNCEKYGVHVICQLKEKPKAMQDNMGDIPKCDDGTVMILNSCYKIVTEAMKWEHAKEHCATIGMTLLVTRSMEEENALIEYLVRASKADGLYPRYWIDVHNDDAGDFFSDGAALNFSDWNHDSPVVLRVHMDRCVQITASPDLHEFGWSDDYCYLARMSICVRNECSGCTSPNITRMPFLFSDESMPMLGCYSSCQSVKAFSPLPLAIFYRWFWASI